MAQRITVHLFVRLLGQGPANLCAVRVRNWTDALERWPILSVMVVAILWNAGLFELNIHMASDQYMTDLLRDPKLTLPLDISNRSIKGNVSGDWKGKARERTARSYVIAMICVHAIICEANRLMQQGEVS